MTRNADAPDSPAHVRIAAIAAIEDLAARMQSDCHRVARTEPGPAGVTHAELASLRHGETVEYRSQCREPGERAWSAIHAAVCGTSHLAELVSRLDAVAETDVMELARLQSGRPLDVPFGLEYVVLVALAALRRSDRDQARRMLRSIPQGHFELPHEGLFHASLTIPSQPIYCEDRPGLFQLVAMALVADAFRERTAAQELARLAVQRLAVAAATTPAWLTEYVEARLEEQRPSGEFVRGVPAAVNWMDTQFGRAPSESTLRRELQVVVGTRTATQRNTTLKILIRDLHVIARRLGYQARAAP